MTDEATTGTEPVTEPVAKKTRRPRADRGTKREVEWMCSLEMPDTPEGEEDPSIVMLSRGRNRKDVEAEAASKVKPGDKIATWYKAARAKTVQMRLV